MHGEAQRLGVSSRPHPGLDETRGTAAVSRFIHRHSHPFAGRHSVRRTRLCLLASLPVLFLAPGTLLPGQESLPASSEPEPLPERLTQTGLYEAGSLEIRADNHAFTPRYTLWSDGATKRRWIFLPPGTSIDASDSNAWDFPPGTRLWKEFSHGRPIETRLIERLGDGTWRFAAYVWDADGRDATLAPAEGVRALPASEAPGGTYAIPSRDDCRVCHEGGAVPVLGFSAFQLAPARDPLSPHAEPGPGDALNIDDLVAQGLLRTPDDSPVPTPETADVSPIARAALGYLHANCGHCHNTVGSLADIGMSLAHVSAVTGTPDTVLESLIDRHADTQVNGLDIRVIPGDPAGSQLLARMKSRNPNHQMPPLGTRVVDAEAVALVEQWIQQLQGPWGDHQ